MLRIVQHLCVLTGATLSVRLKGKRWKLHLVHSLLTPQPNVPSTDGICRTNTTTRSVYNINSSPRSAQTLMARVSAGSSARLSCVPGCPVTQSVHQVGWRDAAQESHWSLSRGTSQDCRLRPDGPSSRSVMLVARRISFLHVLRGKPVLLDSAENPMKYHRHFQKNYIFLHINKLSKCRGHPTWIDGFYCPVLCLSCKDAYF